MFQLSSFYCRYPNCNGLFCEGDRRFGDLSRTRDEDAGNGSDGYCRGLNAYTSHSEAFEVYDTLAIVGRWSHNIANYFGL